MKNDITTHFQAARNYHGCQKWPSVIDYCVIWAHRYSEWRNPGEHTNWPSLKTYTTVVQWLNIYTINITLLLSKIAKYASLLQYQSLHDSPWIGYNKELIPWYRINIKNGEHGKKTLTDTLSEKSSSENRIPLINAPTFYGDTLNRDIYVDPHDQQLRHHQDIFMTVILQAEKIYTNKREIIEKLIYQYCIYWFKPDVPVIKYSIHM